MSHSPRRTSRQNVRTFTLTLPHRTRVERELAEQLFASLAVQQYEAVEISGHSLQPEAAYVAANALTALAKKKCLRKFSIPDCIAGLDNIAAVYVLTALCNAVGNHWNGLHAVDLSSNTLGPRAFQACAAVLRGQPELRELYLLNNGLATPTTNLLREYLCQRPNTNLRVFHCTLNCVGSNGLRDIMQIIKCSPQMENLRLSSLSAAADSRGDIFKVFAITSGLKSLDISDSHINRAGAIALAAALGKQENLETCIFRNLNLGPSQIAQIVEALEQAPAPLKTLDLSGNQLIDDGHQLIERLLATLGSTLRSLYVADTGLSSEGIDHIAKSIESCEPPALQTLSVARNKVRDRQALALATAVLNLKQRFIKLELGENHITKSAVEDIQKKLGSAFGSTAKMVPEEEWNTDEEVDNYFERDFRTAMKAIASASKGNNVEPAPLLTPIRTQVRSDTQAQEVEISSARKQTSDLKESSGSLNDLVPPDTHDEPEEEDDQGEKEKPKRVGFFSLFRYTSTKERIGMILACLCAALHGTALPVFTILFGKVISTFSTTSQDEILSKLQGVTMWFFVLGGVAGVLATIQIRFMLVGAQGAGARMRKLYFKSLMQLDDSWYDAESMKNKSSQAGAYIARLSDVNLIQNGIGDKVAILIQYVTMFVVGFIVAFIHSWKLTLAVLATTPAIAIAGGVMAKVTTDSTEGGLGAYSNAGGIANEGISMIKTVTAFGAQKEEEERFAEQIDKAYKSEVKKGFGMGIGLGSVMFCFMVIFGFSLWLGARFLRTGVMKDAGDVFIVLFSVVIGASGLGQAGPHVNAISIARGAASSIFDIIEKDSEINPLDLSAGRTLNTVNGEIEFQNVSFQYPTRPNDEAADAKLLENFSLKIPAGTSQSLVGESGSGKSTIARLIEKFYTVNGGRLLIDGHDIKDLNVTWLRSIIGYVGQMPTLFAISIKENIALGVKSEIQEDPKTGVKKLIRKEPKMEEIIEAAKLANAHDFIEQLPEGYDTVLGARGALLSGGQKQRVCIARALIRKPKILILDEATASLDSRSEAIVQEAIDGIMRTSSITTVVIAHRLSTVKDTNKIAVLRKGKIQEIGSHQELLNMNGAYKRLIQAQEVSGKEETGKESTHKEKKGTGEGEVDSYDEDESTTEKASETEHSSFTGRILIRAFIYNKSEAFLIVLGILGAILAGSAWPVSSIIMSKMTVKLDPPPGVDTSADIRFLFLMYVVVGAASLIGNTLQFGFLGMSGNRLTKKIRRDAFKKILSQDMGFFDQPGNDVGSLTSRLASEATLVRGLNGDTFGTFAVAISTLGCGLVIAFVWCWRIAAVILALIPGVALGGAMEMKLMTGFGDDADKEYASSAKTAAEAIDGIVTVRSLGVQDHFMEKYNAYVDVPTKLGKRKSWSSGLAFGFSQLAQYVVWGVGFLVGGLFVKQGHCTFEDMMIGILGLIFGAMTLGNIATFTPDFAASRRAARNLFHLLDTEPKIDPYSETGVRLSSVQGKVDLKEVKFEYPTRPDIPVLKGIDLGVKPGKTLAIVGESGSGKSTIVQLLQRFYDVSAGSIGLDDSNIKIWQVQNYRSNIGVVQQEPDLFNRSIKDNICYGLANIDGVPITDGLIEKAAKDANAHDFIMQLPGTYDYVVGERGALLSGGQKQRIAIARSLIRQPKVLLLDEATSALDAESEQKAQEALDKASKTRTTIVIAHRLSTFKSADIIAVVRCGEIIQLGTHDELLEQGGYYNELIRNQLS